MKHFIIICLVAISCTRPVQKKEILVIPPNSMIVINDSPNVPVAFKVDSVQPWQILDSSAALRVVLKSVEDNVKRAMHQPKQPKK